MTGCDDQRTGNRTTGGGFSLVAALLLMVLLSVLAVGMLGLAAIELRRSSQSDQVSMARANARLALIQAIGQLQTTLGPDQRVSATAEILSGNPAQPHWTGVWRSTGDGDSPIFQRDDLDGGLRDTRSGQAAASPVGWLVSGGGDPRSGPPESGAITLGHDENDRPIRVEAVALRRGDGLLHGRQAWWTGDLGVRANIATPDAWREQAAGTGRDAPENRYRLLVAQNVDPSIMDGAGGIEPEEATRLASAGTSGLARKTSPAWARKHVFNVTVDSQGVLADPLRGGLKQDLTPFLSGTGEIADWNGLPGLGERTPLIGRRDEGAAASRTARVSPTFGLLRDWALTAAAEGDRSLDTRLPETDARAGRTSAAYALANENPVRLTGNIRTGLQPILVEATLFTHLSTFRLGPQNPPRFQLRHHHYPRVVLWNPYNVDLEFDRAIIMIQGNGRQELWTENIHYNSDGTASPFRSMGQWLSFEGGRSTIFNARGMAIMQTEGYNDPYLGSYYFSIPRTKFGPGECLVFSPARSAEYDCLSPYRPGAYNLNNNELSCTVAPDPARGYYISGTDIGGGIPYQPARFWYAPTPYWSINGRNGVENQADDTRAVLKQVGSASTITFEDFDRLPQIAVVSASLQFGAGREPRIAWAEQIRMPMELLDRDRPRPTVVPNVRTREGVRLRWFFEHRSNLINSGRLNNTPHFEEALLANWNPRAAFGIRSPWENIGGELPVTGTGGGPWFFGAYTRDLFDEAVGWQDQVPVFTNGRSRGNPFGPPQEGSGRYVLFDVPRAATGVISLGQLQHAKLSDLIWHPSYAIGNSLVDPRLGTGGLAGLDRSAARAHNASAARVGGFHEAQLGWSTDSERSANRDEWARSARAMLGELPSTDNLVFDLSFEANHALWDSFFLSTGSASNKRAFADDPLANPLPNGRMRPVPGVSPARLATAADDFHQAASVLMVDGAFNVNSTRVEAWKALLAATRLSALGDGRNTPFPRVLVNHGDPWQPGSATDGDAVWAGYRELTPDEIDRLARAIVEQVKLRGPFISLADFVNRRLAANQTGRMGALQAAIKAAGINATLTNAWPLDNSRPLPDYRHPDNIPDSTRMEQTLKPDSKVWGAPAWLTQADILQAIGPVLAARSDTFVVRAYGEAVDPAGKTTARAWCEAVVQRTPEPLDPDPSGINSARQGRDDDFGRKFIVQSFRWLDPAEV